MPILDGFQAGEKICEYLNSSNIVSVVGVDQTLLSDVKQDSKRAAMVLEKEMSLVLIPADEWKRHKRPLMCVLSADINPKILQKIETAGFAKGFSIMNKAIIDEIYRDVMDHNLKKQ
jgi:hypothetical protein